MRDKLIHFYVMMGIPIGIFIIKFINIIFTNNSEATGDFNYRVKGLLKETTSLLMINIGLIGFSHLLIYSELLPEFGININTKPILYTFTLVETAIIIAKRIYEIIENKIKNKFVRISHKVKNIKNKKGILSRFFSFGFKMLGFSLIATKLMKKNVDEVVQTIEDDVNKRIKEEHIQLPDIDLPNNYNDDTVRIRLNTKKKRIENINFDNCSLSTIIKMIDKDIKNNEINNTIEITRDMIDNDKSDLFTDNIKTKDLNKDNFNDDDKTI